MDCDDVMLALASPTLRQGKEEDGAFHEHLDDCDTCRALAEENATSWRWIARLPEDAFEGDTAMALPTVDPIVFDIDQEIAAGGMGRITKATDRRLGRDVALKEVLELSMRARFEREAMITARLQHPAIVPIYEAGTFPNGHPFYTMRLVYGGTLGAAIHKTTTMAERLALLPHVLAVTDALAYAHSNRIIHRDLKPGNVLVGEFGETVVIDWGLAKELTAIEAESPMMAPGFGAPSKPSSPSLTRVGSVLGTPGFMSPEQASGAIIDERSDVYALGAILYNLLAGEPPYWDKHDKEGSTRLIAIGLDKPPTPIGEIAPDAPADLKMIVERAMARRKEERYPSAKEMAAELRRFAAGQLIQREYSLRELVGRWINKHRAAVAVGSIAAIALAVVVIVAFIGITRSRGAEVEAREAAEASEKTARAEATRAKQTVARLQEQEGLRELVQGDGSRALAYLAAAYADDRAPDRALAYLLTASYRDHDLLDPSPTRSSGKAIGFAGDAFAVVDTRLHLHGATPTEIDLGADPIQHASFAPSGKLVALHRTTGLEIRDVATGTRRLTIQNLEDVRVVFAPDDARTASFTAATLLVHELGGPDAALALPQKHLPAEIRDAAIDAQHVATCSEDGVRVWRLHEINRDPVVLPTPCTLLAFLDPGVLVIANKRSELLRWEIGEPRPHRTMSGHIPINVIAVNKTAQRIATGDATGVVMWSWNGDALGESRDIIGGIDKLLFTPDGQAFVGAGADDRVFVWDTESFHLRQAFGGGKGAIVGLAIASSGNRIATLTEQQAQLWKVPTGRLLDRAKGRSFATTSTSWITSDHNRIWIRPLSDRHGDPAKVRTIEHHLDALALRATADRVVGIQSDRHGRPSGLVVFDPESATPDLSLRPFDAGPVVGAHASHVITIVDNDVQISDVKTGTEMWRFSFEDKPARAFESPDGLRLAVIVRGRLELHEIPTKQKLGSIDVGDDYTGGVFDASGRRVALFGPHPPTLVIDGLTKIALDKRSSSGTGAVFARSGTRVAVGVGNTVQLWDYTRPRSPLVIVSSTPRDAYALDGHGELLATGSVDGSVRIWNARGGMLDKLVGSQTNITRLQFALDDAILIAQSDDGYALVWDVNVEHSIEELRRIATGSPWELDGATLRLKRP